MRPVLYSRALWLWLWLWIQQAAGAISITSISDNGGNVQVGNLVAVVWDGAVGSVNASLQSSGQNPNVRTVLPLGSMLNIPIYFFLRLR